MQVIENMADPERFERPTLRFVVWQQASKINAFWHDFRREVARKSAVLLAVGTILTAPAFAGGPVIEEAYEAEAATKLSAGEKAALAVGILLLIAAAASGGSKGGSDTCYGGDPQPEPETGCR